MPLRTGDELPKPLTRDCNVVVDEADELRSRRSGADVARGVEPTSRVPDQANIARDLDSRVGTVVYDDDLEALTAEILGREAPQQLREQPMPVPGGNHDGNRERFSIGHGRSTVTSEWGREDSNLRRLSRRVYSPFPLAARAHPLGEAAL